MSLSGRAQERQLQKDEGPEGRNVVIDSLGALAAINCGPAGPPAKAGPNHWRSGATSLSPNVCAHATIHNFAGILYKATSAVARGDQAWLNGSGAEFLRAANEDRVCLCPSRRIEMTGDMIMTKARG